jgi:hypothetical protein
MVLKKNTNKAIDDINKVSAQNLIMPIDKTHKKLRPKTILSTKKKNVLPGEARKA